MSTGLFRGELFWSKNEFSTFFWSFQQHFPQFWRKFPAGLSQLLFPCPEMLFRRNWFFSRDFQFDICLRFLTGNLPKVFRNCIQSECAGDFFRNFLSVKKQLREFTECERKKMGHFSFGLWRGYRNCILCAQRKFSKEDIFFDSLICAEVHPCVWANSIGFWRNIPGKFPSRILRVRNGFSRKTFFLEL